MGTIQTEVSVYHRLETFLKEHPDDWFSSKALREPSAEFADCTSEEVSNKLRYLWERGVALRQKLPFDPLNPQVRYEYKFNPEHVGAPMPKAPAAARGPRKTTGAKQWIKENLGGIGHGLTINELSEDSRLGQFFGSSYAGVRKFLYREMQKRPALVARMRGGIGRDKFLFYNPHADVKVLKPEPVAAPKEIIPARLIHEKPEMPPEVEEHRKLLGLVPAPMMDRATQQYSISVDAKNHSVTLRVGKIEISITNLE